MKEGDIVLVAMPQADNAVKNRPVVFLREMRPFADALVCGVSTQMRQMVAGFDEFVSGEDEDYSSTGLVEPSLIRLGFLAVIPQSKIAGSIGAISSIRHRRLLEKLGSYLTRQ
ncbi:MAG: type II toxin-antitoxin system PemK/MazF family toxin [Chloracidobacterium sp.]|nr:type II toxin-antitoxin system PemK/MazF family toxin [Chloracidobacterium sp.]